MENPQNKNPLSMSKSVLWGSKERTLIYMVDAQKHGIWIMYAFPTRGFILTA